VIKLGVIVTGGTIAATADATTGDMYAPRCGSELIALTHSIGRERGYEVEVELWRNDEGYMPLVDSCQVEPHQWLRLSVQIDDMLTDCLGVVVLHGTDTLAYTATALSLLNPYRHGSVVVTGAQIPAVAVGSDAPANLKLALDAAAGRFGNMAGDTVVAFGDLIMRGVRATKHSTVASRGFRSWACPEIDVRATAIATESTLTAWQQLRAQSSAGKPLSSFAGRIANLRVTPGMDISYVRDVLERTPPDGLLLQLFGVGTAPSVNAWASLVDALASQDILVVGVTTCPEGAIEWRRYQASAALAQSALIDGSDMTFECAYVKLMGVAAEKMPFEAAVERFTTPISHDLTGTALPSRNVDQDNY